MMLLVFFSQGRENRGGFLRVGCLVQEIVVGEEEKKDRVREVKVEQECGRW